MYQLPYHQHSQGFAEDTRVTRVQPPLPTGTMAGISPGRSHSVSRRGHQREPEEPVRSQPSAQNRPVAPAGAESLPWTPRSCTIVPLCSL